jgi:hypothetical protein
MCIGLVFLCILDIAGVSMRLSVGAESRFRERLLVLRIFHNLVGLLAYDHLFKTKKGEGLNGFPHLPSATGWGGGCFWYCSFLGEFFVANCYTLYESIFFSVGGCVNVFVDFG